MKKINIKREVNTMGLIKEYYKNNGTEYLSNYLIGTIKGVIESDSSDSEKVNNIEKLLKEYQEVKDNE